MISSRAAEACSLAASREYEFICSPFLSPAEQAEYLKAAARTDPFTARRLFFFGGCVGADRRRAVFAPSYTDTDTAPIGKNAFDPDREAFFKSVLDCFPEEDLGITPVEVRGSGYVTLSHRDYMGSVLGLGLERDVIGDIAVLSERCAVILADKVIAPFITESLTKIGRDTVKCTPIRLPNDFVIPRKFETLHAVSGSDRADSVTASLSGCSRAEAKLLCTSGSVEVNYASPVEPDARLTPGDIVSVRGHGKFVIDSFDGETRSGRLRLTARRYL